jgi:hypothetical protein
MTGPVHAYGADKHHTSHSGFLGRFQEAPRGDYRIQEENGSGPAQFCGQMIENFASCQGVAAQLHVAKVG